ncbi:tetratricopeptide repeat protein [Streptomyces niveus]|uniref:tetratricopeptide repeat protein n=1 Tax=Streptomyces niveus TaxID=193462 RepID=UPI0036D2270A
MFRETFARNPEEADFPYLFHVHGNGGVGKSTLVRQWEATAREQASVVTAFVDDEVHDALEAMETVSTRLSRQGHSLKKFDKQLATYRHRRHQAESTVPVQQSAAGEAGAGEPVPASPSSTVAAQVGLVGLGMLPGIGAFTGAVDPGQVALAGDRMRTMLNTRLRSHDDVQLVMNPLANLTPVFLEDLAEVAERCERVVLFFDVYERTGPVLNAWLQSIIFTEDHGTLPVNVQIVLSGRSHLDTHVWGDQLGQVTEVGLDVFTDDEARTLLATHGVTDEENIELVLRLSGRLPLLVDMLARSGPSTSDTGADPSETAVERFLKWEPDPERREAAQACALPLQLDEDIYQVAVPESAADGYAWLRALAFVSHQAGRCRYHDVVRDTMLRLQRTQSPTRWQQQHTRLTDAFEQWRRDVEAGLGTDTDTYWDDPTWREHRLNETYHRLCANPRTALPDALLQTIHATDHNMATLRRWAQALGQAGHDTDAPALTSWSQRLETAAEQEAAGVAVLTLLLTAPELDTAARTLAHTARARDHRTAGDYDKALADYATAHRLAPDTARVHAGRGKTYRLMGRYDDALTDLNRAIELNPELDGAIASRGETYRLMGRYDDALTDLNRAIQLNPNYTWAIASRGETYRLMGRYDDALTDLNRAIQLDPNYTWAIASRGQTYRAMGRYDDALTDLNRAIQLNPELDGAIASRGETYRLMGRYDDALTDLNRAIQLNPNYTWAIANRGQTYRAMGRYDDALTDLTHAIQLNPELDGAIANRGLTYRLMGRYDDALTDLNRAIQLNPNYTWAIANRGLTYGAMGRYDDALTDLNRAIQLNPEANWAIASRGLTYRLMGRYDDALTDLNRAIQLNPEANWAIANRGETYRLMGRYDDALTDLNRAIQLNPEANWAIANRGRTYRSLERYDEALTDFNRAIELNPLSGWTLYERAMTNRRSGCSDDGSDLARAVELFTGDAEKAGGPGATGRGNLVVAFCAVTRWADAEQALTVFLEPLPSRIHILDLITDLDQLLLMTSLGSEPVLRFRERLLQALGGA